MKKSLLTILGTASLFSAVAQVSPSWSLTQNTNYTVTFAGVKFIDALDDKTVWMTGYDGQNAGRNYAWWARTVNGGSSYTSGSIYPDTNTYVAANMEGINNCTAWVSAYMKSTQDRGALWRTTNGGTTWTVAPGTAGMFTVAGQSFLNVVSFLSDKKTGMCMGDPIAGEFEIYRTTDAGATWTMVPGANIPNPLAGEYGLVNIYEKRGSNMWWFGTNKNRVYRSTDAGLTWSVSAAMTSTIGGGNVLGVNDIAFCTNSVGIANAYFGPTGNGTLSVFTTTDGGATWTEIPTIDANYGKNDVVGVPGTSVLASCGAGTGNQLISFSQDGGITWNNWGGTNIQYLCLDFVSPNVGWAGSFGSGTVGIGGAFKYTGGLLNPAPWAAFSFSTANCPNYCTGTYTMSNFSSGNPAPTYSWSASSGSITSPTATNAVIDFTASGNHTITLTATTGTNSSTYSMVIPITLCTGAEELGATASSFRMYPNPAGEVIYIEMSNDNDGFTYTLTDMLGKQVMSSKVSHSRASVNVSDLATGVYFMTVESAGDKTVKKIIVE